MLKRLVIVLVFLLSSCGDKRIECYKRNDSIEVNLSINYTFDYIDYIEVNEIIEIDYDLFLFNKERIIEELDGLDYKINENRIYFNKIIHSDNYRLRRTIEELRKEGFYCE